MGAETYSSIYGSDIISSTAYIGVISLFKIFTTQVKIGSCTLYIRARMMTLPAVATPSATLNHKF